VLHLLRRYLGEYVHGLSSEALRISVWKGDVVLTDLKLKAEALNSLKLPEAMSATLDALSKSKLGNSATGNSWLGSLIGTIIGNLKISIGNVHIRYEDSISNPGHPFAVGVTLAKLAAFTVDKKGNETFDTSGALDKLRKLELANSGTVTPSLCSFIGGGATVALSIETERAHPSGTVKRIDGDVQMETPPAAAARVG
ncbi:hypothetical protein M8C21_020745, partial [Ambrosia artemisiifolia]